MHIEYKERRRKEEKKGNRRVKFSDANTRRRRKNNENDKTKQTNKQAHDIFVVFFSSHQSNLQNMTRPKTTSIDTPRHFNVIFA